MTDPLYPDDLPHTAALRAALARQAAKSEAAYANECRVARAKVAVQEMVFDLAEGIEYGSPIADDDSALPHD